MADNPEPQLGFFATIELEVLRNNNILVKSATLVCKTKNLPEIDAVFLHGSVVDFDTERESLKISSSLIDQDLHLGAIIQFNCDINISGSHTEVLRVGVRNTDSKPIKTHSMDFQWKYRGLKDLGGKTFYAVGSWDVENEVVKIKLDIKKSIS